MSLNKAEMVRSLINENEDYVFRSIDTYIKKNKGHLDFCACEECVLDIMAIALNKLKPKYRLMCRHMHKDSETVVKIKKEVDAAVIDSIKSVQESPHH